MKELQERYHEYISRRFREARNETIANVDATENRITVLEEKVTQLEKFVKSIMGPY